MSTGVRYAGLFAGVMLISAGAAFAPPQPAVGPSATPQEITWKGPDGSPLPFRSDEEVVEFLQEAEIQSSSDIPFGVTNPRNVVLQRGGLLLRAALRDYDEVFEEARVGDDFFPRLRDSFIFDVPAYQMSRLLGLDNIPPVVFRRIGNRRVTLQAWREGALMEFDRLEQGIEPPSYRRYREQEQNMRVFDSIIGNVDRHNRNFLTDEDGRFWLIDHSRSFLRSDRTPYLDSVTMCGRTLFERIKALQRAELLELLSPPLSESEVDWVLRRRDKVVAHIEEVIATRGDENIVLFDDSGSGRASKALSEPMSLGGSRR
jgi:hypothetical protein